ncbi:MAG: N-6 DNA methylase [Chloroflexi bacterium]|nr:N-6 DNA methylase [Chloroflexota bacterium]
MAGEFVTVRSEGGLLPPDLLQRIVGGDRDLDGFQPQEYGLAATDRLGEAAARAWARAKTYWAAFRAATEGLPDSETGVTQTREQWLLPLLRELGYRDVEYRAAAESIGERRYSLSHRSESLPLHLVSFRQSLDRAAPAAAGQRRMSPHALLQEYLNVSDASYGIVSNGLQLRLLRDSASLTRLAYVELDLEAMFEGGVYADFVLIYLVMHRSRLPRGGTEAGQCWLEQWRTKAESQGARAMGELRNGVEAAIAALGSGFLSHPDNEKLRERLHGGGLSAAQYYQQLLRLIYRLIFLFVAEERDLVFPAQADPANKRRYLDHYSASRLRSITHKYLTDDRHDDLWRSLRITFQLLAGQRQGLGVPALGGGLFDSESCPDLDCCAVRNDALAEAIRRLSWVRVGRITRRVNYRDMDAEELGGVYEGLLGRQPRIVAGEFQVRFELVGSGQRKQTGSYYTPTPLVQELIRSALEPVIADRLKDVKTPELRRQALLRITVCDPACGSGHFLLAAARRLAQELARVEAGDAEPGPADLRSALRQVITHCIYGVDLNPLAVDLCKLALWMEGHDPGRPLSFLDHRIKIGNSLIGVTPELVAKGVPDDAFEPVTGDDKKIASAIKKRNKQERSQYSFASIGNGEWSDLSETLGLKSLEIAELAQADATMVAEQREQYLAFQREQVEPAEWPLHVWTAAFFWPFAPDVPEPPTTGLLTTAKLGQPLNLSLQQGAVVERLRREHGFFHWPLEFPEVFADGGFDCVLGNPPWERIKLQEEEFFADRDEAIAQAPNKAARQRLIDELSETALGQRLFTVFQEAKRAAEAESKFVRASGRFPLTAVGDVNLYALFAEHDRAIVNGKGRLGVVVPTGIATDDTTKSFFSYLIRSATLACLFDLENRENIFPGVGHGRYKFCLLTITGEATSVADFAFYLTNTGQIKDYRRHFQLKAHDFDLLNPNTRTCPIFRTRFDAELTKAIYDRVPVIINETTNCNPWGIRFVTMFHMSNDSALFEMAPTDACLPIYEGKMTHQFDHRYATYESLDKQGDIHMLPVSPLEKHQDPNYSVHPRYYVAKQHVNSRIDDATNRNWLLVYRDVTSTGLERTMIATILPRVGVGNSLPMILIHDSFSAEYMTCFLANLNCLVFDYVVRQKVGGAHINFFIIRQFPALPPSAFIETDLHFIVQRVLELVYTAWDLGEFAQDCGYDGPPFRWDESHRALLRAELDAYYAALYGLTRDELRYVLDASDVYGPDFPGETFRVLKEREIREYGEYRTRRLVLEAWDRLGLAPRNRDGRYSVEPQPSVTALSSLDGAGSEVGRRRPAVQEPTTAYLSGSARMSRASSLTERKAAGKAKRVSGPTISDETGRPDVQPTLPGMAREGQLGFGDIEIEKDK